MIPIIQIELKNVRIITGTIENSQIAHEAKNAVYVSNSLGFDTQRCDHPFLFDDRVP